MPRGVKLQILLGPITFSPAPADLIDAVQEVQVTQNAGQRSGFQIRLALGASSSLDRMLAGRTLDPPNRMLIVVHIDGRPTVLSDGVITRHDVSKSNDAGGSSLSITGVDVSQMMDLIDMSGLPLPMPAEARVLTLLAPFAAYGCVPLVIPSPLLFVPNPITKIPQVQGTAYTYITRLADDVGYTFFVEPGPTPGMNVAYWGPDVRVGPAQPALTVNSDASSNVESLSFSFDGIQRTVYILTVYPEQLKVPIPIPLPDLTPLSPPLGSKIPIPLSYKRMNIERQTGRRQERRQHGADGGGADRVAWSRPGGPVGQRDQRVGVDRRPALRPAAAVPPAGRCARRRPGLRRRVRGEERHHLAQARRAEAAVHAEPQRPGGPRNEGGSVRERVLERANQQYGDEGSLVHHHRRPSRAEHLAMVHQ